MASNLILYCYVSVKAPDLSFSFCHLIFHLNTSILFHVVISSLLLQHYSW